MLIASTLDPRVVRARPLMSHVCPESGKSRGARSSGRACGNRDPSGILRARDTAFIRHTRYAAVTTNDKRAQNIIKTHMRGMETIAMEKPLSVCVRLFPQIYYTTHSWLCGINRKRHLVLGAISITPAYRTLRYDRVHDDGVESGEAEAREQDVGRPVID